MRHDKIQKSGFTLIELLVVFSVMVILSTIGIASFVTYSRSQQVDTTMKEFKTTLFTARSRAISQLRDSSCYASGFPSQNYVLKGYQVVVCCVGNALCAGMSCNYPTNNYELQAVYQNSGGTGIATETCMGKKFPNANIAINFPSTNATYFFFGSITGEVETNASGQIPQFSLTGYGITKVASVSATGLVQ